MRYLLTFLLFLGTLVHTQAATSAATDVVRPQLNALGGLIEPPIDWSTYPRPVKTGKLTDELKHPTTKTFIMKYLM
ncbi:MAG TPA: hypothetical protein VHX44_03225 [Planctomycetota bacterium]|nr:hypothetical protein [Planctomycetota bacterium]